jgi:hypothetical protein
MTTRENNNIGAKIFLIIFVLSIISPACAFAIDASVINVKGKAFYAASDMQWKPVQQPLSLKKDNSVKTAAASFLELKIDDKNRFRILENTELKITSLGDSKNLPDGKVIKLVSLNLYNGKVASKLDKLPSGVRVNIESPSAVASALGTAFIVSADSKSSASSVSVMDSEVIVASSEEPDRSTIVKPYKSVDVMPWDGAYIKAEGSGLPSKEALKRAAGLSGAEQSVITAEGSGHNADEAKSNALTKLNEKIYLMKLDDERNVTDVLNNETASRLLNKIANATIIALPPDKDGMSRVRAEIALLNIEEALGHKLILAAGRVYQMAVEDYGRKFGAQTRLMAKRAAVVDSYRRLAEMIYGVVIDSKTTVRDFTTTSDVVKVSVEGVIKGAKIVDEKYYSDGMVSVTSIVKGTDLKQRVADVKPDVNFGKNYISAPQNIGVLQYMDYMAF